MKWKLVNFKGFGGILKQPWLLISLVFIAGIFCFYKLDRFPVERWDESTNYEIVSQSSGWVLKYQDKLFFEKPPLWYFLGIIFSIFLGKSIFSLRLISALAGFLIIFLTYFISKRFFSNKAGVFAVLVLLSSGQLFIPNSGGFFATHNFRSADVDALQILFILLSFYCYYLVLQKKDYGIILGSIFCALAVLTKGPLGLLPFAVVLRYLKKNQILKSLLIFSIIVFPWYLFMVLNFGQEFIKGYFGYHLMQRAISPLEGHQEPFYFYFNVLLNKDVFSGFELLVLSLLFVFAKKTKRVDQRYFSLSMMVISILLIATIMRTKLAWYILPIYPFAAILIGGILNDLWTNSQTGKYKYWSYAVVLIAIILMVLLLVRNLLYIFLSTF